MIATKRFIHFYEVRISVQRTKKSKLKLKWKLNEG